MIVSDLQSLAVPIGKVRTMKGNPRRGDVDAVVRSLEAFGQRKPIVARVETGEVIAGNHTFMAAQRLGWEEIAVVWVEDDDTTAKAFALADNRTSDLGEYDSEALAEMMAEVLEEEAELLTAASYSIADLDDLLAAALVAEPSSDEDDAPSAGMSNRDKQAVVSYTLVFDGPDQQAQWFAFIRDLRSKYEGETVAERLATFLTEQGFG
jgi:hypothetical protein